MNRYRFTLEFQTDDDMAVALIRDHAVEAVADEVDGKVTGHVVRDVIDGDEWDRLPLMQK